MLKTCHSPVSRSLVHIKVSQGDVDNPQKLVNSNKIAVQDSEHNLGHITLLWDLSAITAQNRIGFK
jgi:hypothetical protein